MLSSEFFFAALVTRYTAEENKVKSLDCPDRDHCSVAVTGQVAKDVLEQEGFELEKFMFGPDGTRRNARNLATDHHCPVAWHSTYRACGPIQLLRRPLQRCD